MISRFTVVAFDTTPEGHHFGTAFNQIYQGQFGICPLRTTSAEVPSSSIFFSNPSVAVETSCDPNSFPANDEEDALSGGTLTFRLVVNSNSNTSNDEEDHNNNNDSASASSIHVYSYSWSQLNLNGFSLAVISAPQSVVDRWIRSGRSDVHVVPGSHAHRIWLERISGLKKFVSFWQQANKKKSDNNGEDNNNEGASEVVESKNGNDIISKCTTSNSSFVIKLSNLFPLVVSDNVRRLNQFINSSNNNSSSSSSSSLTEIMNRLEIEINVAPPSHMPSRGRCFIGDVVVGIVEASSASPSFILRTNNNSSNRNLTCEFLNGCISLAPVGVRDSSTHVNSKSIDPREGLPTTYGLGMSWLATDSGLVGVAAASSNNDDQDGSSSSGNKAIVREKAMSFTCFGRLLNPLRSEETLSIRDLALRPRSLLFRTPIIAVSGTSAECGKTTMTCKLIKELSSFGGSNNTHHQRRVGAMKLTGTGGTEDSSNHRDAGAVFTADQVDSGLPTTYQLHPDEFKRKILTSFLAAEDANLDVVVVELGGDIIFANNSELLKMDAFVHNLVGLLLISNDALGAYGGARWLSEKYPLVAPKARIVASPFRNFEGMKKRFAFLGLAEPFDANDVEGMANLFSPNLRRTSHNNE